MEARIRSVQQGDANALAYIQAESWKAGYSEVVLWVFRDNLRARAFYEAKGFSLTDCWKPAFHTEEVLYSKRL